MIADLTGRDLYVVGLAEMTAEYSRGIHQSTEAQNDF